MTQIVINAFEFIDINDNESGPVQIEMAYEIVISAAVVQSGKMIVCSLIFELLFLLLV